MVVWFLIVLWFFLGGGLYYFYFFCFVCNFGSFFFFSLDVLPVRTGLKFALSLLLGTQVYLVLPYAVGGDLDGVMKGEHSLGEGDAMPLMDQVPKCLLSCLPCLCACVLACLLS